MAVSINTENGREGRLEWDPRNKDTLIGEGAFGSVYRGILDYQPVAIKVFKKSSRGSNSVLTSSEKAAQTQHQRELRRMLKIKPYPCLVQFLGSFRHESGEELIVTELLEGGSLHESLQLMRNKLGQNDSGTFLDEGSFLRIGGNIARGILHLHNEKLTHGDLKPHNVLLTSRVEGLNDDNVPYFRPDVRAKLIDFGLSRRTSNLMDTISEATTVFAPGPAGTFAYMAPQVLEGIDESDGNVGEIACAADIYAFAIVMYELLCGRQPWIAENVRNVPQLLRLVFSENRRPSWGPRKTSIRPEYVDFVEKCWVADYKERPTSSQVARQFHIWEAAYGKRKASVDSEDDDANGKEFSPVVTGVGAFNEDKNEPASYSDQPNGPSVQAAAGTDPNDSVPPDDDFPNFERVDTTPLDPDEASSLRKRVIAPVGTKLEDIGDSTDTRIDGNTKFASANDTKQGQDYYEDMTFSAADDTIVGHPVKRVVSQPLAPPKLEGLGLPLAQVIAPEVAPLNNVLMGQIENAPAQAQGGFGGFGDSFMNAIEKVNIAADAQATDATGNTAQTNVITSQPMQAPKLDLNQFLAPTPPQQPTLDVTPPGLSIPSTGPYAPIPAPPQTSQQQTAWNMMTGNQQQQPATTMVAPSIAVSRPVVTTNYVPTTYPHAVSVRTIIDAIQAHNAYQLLDYYWNKGYGTVIAQAFLNGAIQSPPVLTAKHHFELALSILKRNNDPPCQHAEYLTHLEQIGDPRFNHYKNNRPAGWYHPGVARDLCSAIGSLIHHNPSVVDQQTALNALRTTLRSMQAFLNNPLVYSACCLALSNLLKINNRIPNTMEHSSLRKEIANWIVHAISFNVREQYSISLAYTGACAARNFMWMNEANTDAFLSGNSKLFQTSPLHKLIQSARTFEKQDFILESILATFATICYFPRFRYQFVRDRGVEVLCDFLRQSMRRGNACVLCLSVLACIASDSEVISADDRIMVRTALISNEAPGAVVHSLRFSLEGQQQSRSISGLGIMSESLSAIAAFSNFDDNLRSSLVDFDAVRLVTDAIRGFAVTHTTLIHSTLRTICAGRMCDAVLALAKSSVGLNRLREGNLVQMLRNIKVLFQSDKQVVESAEQAISVLVST